MPYIKNERRSTLAFDDPANAGELDFLITRLALDYIVGKEQTFELLNSVVGVLDNAKFEFQRRLLAPHADRKIEENGDVYTTVDLVFADTPEPVGGDSPIELLGGTRGYPTSAVIRCVHMKSIPYTCSLYVGETHIRSIDLKTFTYDQIAHAVFNEDWYVDVVQSSPGSSPEAIEIHIRWAGDISVEDAEC